MPPQDNPQDPTSNVTPPAGGAGSDPSVPPAGGDTPGAAPEPPVTPPSDPGAPGSDPGAGPAPQDPVPPAGV